MNKYRGEMTPGNKNICSTAKRTFLERSCGGLEQRQTGQTKKKKSEDVQTPQQRTHSRTIKDRRRRRKVKGERTQQVRATSKGAQSDSCSEEPLLKKSAEANGASEENRQAQ